MDLFSDEIRARERKRRRREPLWGLLSFLLHAAFFTAIILFTPVKKLVIPERTENRHSSAELTADRLEDLAETLTTVRMNELLRQVEAMQAALRDMDAMKDEIAKDYDAFAAHEVESAKQQLEKFVEETAANQTKSVEAQAIVKREIEAIVRIETRRNLKEMNTSKELSEKRDRLLYETVEKTNTAQANAVNSLDKLSVTAAFTGFKRTSEAAEKLREAQMEVAKLQDTAQTEVIEVASDATQIAWAFARVEHERKEVAEAEELLRKKASDHNKRIKETHKARLEDAQKRFNEFEQKRQQRATERQLERLDRAANAQKELNKRLETLRATLAADESKIEHLAQADRRVENELVTARADKMTLGEAYELARRLEGAIAESYKDIKATETAIARKMSFDAAQKITDVATPERLHPDVAALTEKVRTQDALDRRKRAEAEVVHEADNMVEATSAMLEDAVKIVRSKADMPIEQRLAAMDASSVYQVELSAAAAEDTSAKAKDLATLMTRFEASGASVKGATKGPPTLKGGDLGLLPGNVMRVSERGKDGVEAAWMYVNSWYVIGPFPNPNRVNLRRKFAPESVQDLDATYAGKNGKTLRWQFWQAKSSKPPEPWMDDWRAEVIPEGAEEYAIYYAYAEVFFDEACDRWVAIGSDDRSDVWLNDIPIWGSSNRLKAWQLAEDFRRVHFKKGRNRILVRIENGHWNMGWSICISTSDE